MITMFNISVIDTILSINNDRSVAINTNISVRLGRLDTTITKLNNAT
jgi:hypothetical protein